MRWLLIALLAFLTSAPASADSWELPSRQTYLSSNKAVRLIVEPRAIDNQFSYFDDKVKGREPAGQRAGDNRRSAYGTLERRVGGAWVKLWDATLRNEVAPVSALVSNDGAHVVTFDNWHSVGFGDNVVVIYSADGAVVRSFRLDDLLPADYIRALPRSVSSLWWHGEHRFSPDGRQLLLAIVVPNDEISAFDPRETIDMAVDLNTGALASPSGATWDRARARATQVARDRDAAEAARKAAFVGPLSAPVSNDEAAWHTYMVEAFFRLNMDGQQVVPDAIVLRAPTERDYEESEGWVRDALRRVDEPEVVMPAAPAAADRLVTVVRQVARDLAPDALKGVRIYLALPAAPAAAIRAALNRSGADLTVIDLAAAIPQRPERLRREAPMMGGSSALRRADAERSASTAEASSREDIDALEEAADMLEAEAEAAAEALQAPSTPDPR